MSDHFKTLSELIMYYVLSKTYPVKTHKRYPNRCIITDMALAIRRGLRGLTGDVTAELTAAGRAVTERQRTEYTG